MGGWTQDRSDFAMKQLWISKTVEEAEPSFGGSLTILSTSTYNPEVAGLLATV